MRNALLPLLLSACTLTEEGFAETFAQRWCAESKACSEDAYFDRWLEGTPECRATTTEDVTRRSYGNGNDACRFQEELASACLADVGDASCGDLASEEWYASCLEVWDCVAVFSP
jgi:hypothetical protein